MSSCMTPTDRDASKDNPQPSQSLEAVALRDYTTSGFINSFAGVSYVLREVSSHWFQTEKLSSSLSAFPQIKQLQ